jgi:GMP synthase (glutamine-hydrolysing)
MRTAWVLQHIGCEPPGIFSELLREHGIAIATAELDDGDELPDWREADMVLAMGGPMSVHDEADHPWLVKEKAWIAAAVRAGVPYLGVCLGAQLLAASLGAPVWTGAVPEVGILPVSVSAGGQSDPVFSALDPQFLALQWHGDTFGLPSGAVHLAGSPAYQNQAFRFGAVAYAVQFHVEVSRPMLAEWKHIAAYRASAEAALGPAGLEHLEADFTAAEAAMAESAARILTSWLELAGHSRAGRISA